MSIMPISRPLGRGALVVALALVGVCSAETLLAQGGPEQSAQPAAEHAAASPEEGAAGHAAEPAPGPLAWSTDLMLWSLVVFVIFLLVLTRLAWKPMTQGLDDRERRIRDDIDGAEQARLKSEKMLAEHAEKLDRVQDEVKEILATARRDAETARQHIMDRAASEAEATKNRAVSEIERARDQALKELFDTMSTGVAEATEHVLGHGLNGDTQQRLIDEALARFDERGVVSRN